MPGRYCSKHILVGFIAYLIAVSLQVSGLATTIDLANGKIKMKVPDEWTRKQPRVNLIQYEFAAKAVDSDKADARMTIMKAGGSVAANIDRWIGQFSQPDGKPTKETTKIRKAKIEDQEIHLVDISGTFSDRRGPFAPAVKREGYRMLGAIVAIPDLGQFFVKFYGPQATVGQHAKNFHKMIESLRLQ